MNQVYAIGQELPTVFGVGSNGYTITELTAVPESQHSTTYARYRFVAEDKSRFEKSFCCKAMKKIKQHPRIVGWIDESGRWFS